MIRYLIFSTFIIATVPVFFVGCVSVSLAPTPATRAEKVAFQAPPSPFIPIKTESADKAWQSKKTGNTLAYLSECSPSLDTQLKTLEQESLNALIDLKILKSVNNSFGDRDALETLAEGKVDGVPVRVSLLTFQKNGCNYILSYMGRRTKFDAEATTFDHFKESFKVP